MTDTTNETLEFIVSPLIEELAHETLRLYADYKTCANAAEKLDLLSAEWGSPRVLNDAQRTPVTRAALQDKILAFYEEAQECNAHWLPEAGEGKKYESTLYVARQKLLLEMSAYLQDAAEKNGLEAPPREIILSLGKGGKSLG